MRFRELPVGPSRHLVRFLVSARRTYALKEEPSMVAGREFEVLRHLETLGLPAVHAVGIADAPGTGATGTPSSPAFRWRASPCGGTTSWTWKWWSP